MTVGLNGFGFGVFFRHQVPSLLIGHPGRVDAGHSGPTRLVGTPTAPFSIERTR